MNTAVDLPVRWVVGLICAGACASLATIHAGLRWYDRHVVRVEHWQPPRATETTTTAGNPPIVRPSPSAVYPPKESS